MSNSAWKWIKRAGTLNVLLVFFPIALVSQAAGASELWVFATSAAAIIPLAGLMGRSTEMLADRLGPGLGGLLNASFGNAAELIIAIFALQRGLLDIVKASITGSILGNILLVLGASSLAGGMRHREQKFNATAAGISATMLALSAIGLLFPAIFHAHLQVHHLVANEAEVSLDIAIVLFVCYLLLLLFSLVTHRHLYLPDKKNEEVDSEDHWPLWVSAVVLIVATLAVTVMSHTLVGAVEAASKQLGWTELFVGVIVVAIVGNAAEHSTAVLVARKNQMELAFQIAIGSGLQIALFVAPLLVFISRLPGFQHMDLLFTTLEVASIAVSVIVVGLVAIDGESTWIEGLLLIAVYLIIGIAFYHLPPSPAPTIIETVAH